MLKLRKALLLNKLYILLVLLVLIYAFIITTLIKHKSVYLKSETEFKAKLVEYKFDGNKLSIEAIGKERLVGTYYIKTKEEKEFLKSTLKFGDILNLKGTLEIPSNNTVPYLFNYKKYLYNKKVYYIIKIDSINIFHKNKNVFYDIKNSIYKHANEYKNNSYIYAFILGKTYNIKEEVLDSYRSNGISHLFALSGLHVSIFSMFILKFLKKIKVSEFYRYLFTFMFLLLFSFISGFSPSILRASLLFFLLGINKVFYFNIETKNVLYLVFFILVLFNPYLIYNLSFILSFTSTFFLIISSELINDKKYIKALFKTSLLSFISNLFLSIYYFGYVNPLGVFANLIFVPIVSFLIFPLTIITFIFPFLSFILYFLTNIMEYLSIKVSTLSLKIYFPHVSLILVYLYYFFLILAIKRKNKKYIFPILLVIVYSYIKSYLDTSTYIYFIDVGQGDSSLIITPHLKKAILIDTGGKFSYKTEDWKVRNNVYSIGEDTIIALIKKLGVKKLDYLILSHGDADHAGEALNIVNNFKVNNIFTNKGKYNNIEKKIPNIKSFESSEIIIDNIYIYSLNNTVFNNENDDSLVLLLNINNLKFLYMGDASIKTEESIINNYNLPQVDVLKVGHHGSKTSSSKLFLSYVKPKISVISVGKNNSFGHPNQEIVERLNEFKSKIYRTDKLGSIEIKINRNGYKIRTYSP